MVASTNSDCHDKNNLVNLDCANNWDIFNKRNADSITLCKFDSIYPLITLPRPLGQSQWEYIS